MHAAPGAVQPLPIPKVQILAPAHGTFSQAAAIQVDGVVTGARYEHGTLRVNGVPVALSATGAFSTWVALDSASIFNGILAEYELPGVGVLAADRVVAISGASILQGEPVPNAVGLRVPDAGFDCVQPEVEYFLIQQHAIDFNSLVQAVPPIYLDLPAGLQLSLVFTGAGFLCHSTDLDTQPGQLHGGLKIWDAHVSYHAELKWNSGPIGVEVIACDGVVTASLGFAGTSLAFHPSSGAPGEVDVEQTGPIDLQVANIHHTFTGGLCDIPGLDALLNQLVEPKIKDEIYLKLHQITTQLTATGDTFLAEAVEEAINGISITKSIGQDLGTAVSGDISSIQLVDEGLRVGIEAAIAPKSPAPLAPHLTAALHEPGPLPPVGPKTPSGKSYGLSTSIALSALNHLLASEIENGLMQSDLYQLGLGGSTMEVTAGNLSSAFPPLAGLGATTPLVVRLRPTLAPIVVAQPGPAGSTATLKISHWLLEIAHPGATGPGSSILTVAIDLDIGLDIGFDPSKSKLSFDLVAPLETELHVVSLENALGLPVGNLPPIALAAYQGILPQLSQALASFPLPKFAELALKGVQTALDGPYISAYFDLVPTHGRPDLIVTDVVAPPVIDRNTPFVIKLKVKNVGTQPAYGFVDCGALLSLDTQMFTGNEFGLGQVPFLLGNDGPGDALEPGETETFTFTTLPASSAVKGQQYLFVNVDLSPLPYGFPAAGALCEGSEDNNSMMVPIEVSAPDAWVGSVATPSGLLAIPVAGKYSTVVGRDMLGPDQLYVPVSIAVGEPPIHTAFGGAWLGRGESKTVELLVDTPAPTPVCGGSATYAVKASANLLDDADESNDASTGSVTIANPYWNLIYELLGVPAQAGKCGTLDWLVKVTNVGNVDSILLCSRTGIGLHQGDVWTDCLPLRTWQVPPLHPGESATFHVDDYFVGANGGCGIVASGLQYVKAGVDMFAGCHDDCTEGNYASQAIQVLGPDLGIDHIDVPTGLVGGQGTGDYVVTLRNFGGATAFGAQLTVAVCGNQATVPVPAVAPGASKSITVTLFTCPVPFTCGGSFTKTVSATLASTPDEDPSNNSLTANVQIASSFFDLGYEVISSQSTYKKCSAGQPIGWSVRVTNHGNITSVPVCSKTALSLSSGNPDNWTDTAGIVFFTVPALAPGASSTFQVNGYNLCQPNVVLGQQFLKAGVDGNYCEDDCSAGNSAAKAVSIVP